MSHCPSHDYDNWVSQEEAEQDYLMQLLDAAIQGGYICVENDVIGENGYHTMTIAFPKTQLEIDQEKWKSEEYAEYLKMRDITE